MRRAEISMHHRRPLRRSPSARPTRVVLAILLAALAAAPLAACSCIWVDHGFLVSSGTELPANARGVPWWGSLEREGGESGRVLPPDPRRFRVERVPETGPSYAVPFTLELLDDPPLDDDETLVLVVPSMPLEPGQRLRFIFERPPNRDADGEPQPVPPDQAEVTIAADKLTGDRVDLELGQRTRGKLRTTTLEGSCATEIDADQLVVGLPEDVARWGEALLYVTRVDGKVWRPSTTLCAWVPPGRGWVAPGRERLFASCGPYQASPAYHLDAGVHRAEMVAWLPGTDVEVTAARDVRLDCGERP